MLWEKRREQTGAERWSFFFISFSFSGGLLWGGRVCGGGEGRQGRDRRLVVGVDQGFAGRRGAGARGSPARGGPAE